MVAKSLLVHGGLLALAAGLAGRSWLKEDASPSRGEIELWGGNSSQIERIEYEAPDKKAVLVGNKDALGRYWVVELESEKAAARPLSPHGAPPPQDDAPKERELTKFIGVTEAESFAEQFAPLRAVRSLGVLEPARLPEFGFDETTPVGVLKVHIGGKTRELVLGGKPPGGGGHLYVREPASGQAYVLGGGLGGDLNALRNRLMQRAFHTFDSSDIARAKISAGEKSRELVRVDGQSSFWAPPSEPQKKDESASNWMTKLAQLSATSYHEALEPEPSAVVRVELFAKGGKSLGFVQLARADGEEENKPIYYAKSETSRWWASVAGSSASQLEEDLASAVGD